MPNKLEESIIKHEGKIAHAYQDTKGYWTVGIGKCIDARIKCGLSEDEMLYLLRQEISQKRKELMVHSWFTMLDTVRQELITELAFNIGVGGVLKFKKMIAAIKEGDFQEASVELLNSQWRKDVGPTRSADMAYRLLHGRYK